MPRYFIEVSYKGTAYAGFQAQENANTIQAEVEKAFLVFFREPCLLTGSSRTDAGVHALQNFFHADFIEIKEPENAAYHLNAILPADIVIENILPVKSDAHCRFDAVSRTYEYSIYNHKNPFLSDRAYFFPFPLNLDLLGEAASIIREERNFEAFSKRNTQVKTFECNIYESEWLEREGRLVYQVTGNRFLRGMVRGLVGTMLRVGRGKTTVTRFKEIIASRDHANADFSVPAHGLTLIKVSY
ncbi:MAG: tRNA pseudouridine(38-40) synthase TruA [Ferruginibacter sp.]